MTVVPGPGRRLLAAALTGGVLVLGVGVAARAAPAPPEAWHSAALHLAEAHALSRGAGVTVAVLDSGAAEHADLREALLPQVDVAPSGTRIDPARGTELAGLIAARGDGHAGLLGVAPQSRILPVRVSTRGFDAQPDAVAAGIDRAVAAGAKVIVSSYARPEVSGALATAVRHALAADVLIVSPAAPATANSMTLGDLPGVVTVTAADQRGLPTRATVNGLHIDVAAPGEKLVAPVRASLGDAYAEVGGGDFAAALAGGVAALVRSKFPQLPAADVARRLELGTRRDMSLGWGSIDAAEALSRTLVALTAPRPVAPSRAAQVSPRDRQWYLDAIHLSDAHRVTLGEDVTLGLVAGGIDADRPDLAGRIDQQVLINNDGSADAAPADPVLSAGTAAAVLAVGAGGSGYLGAAPAARLIVASSRAGTRSTQVETAVRWLVDHGSKIVLVIDGAPSLTPDAAAYALGHDAVIVAPYSPTVPGVAGVITVRGVGPDEASAAGIQPALSAPGEANLLLDDGHAASASPDETAAALVSGVVALIRAHHPEANANAVVQHLLSTAAPTTADSETLYGRGVVDALAALTTAVAPAAANRLGTPAAVPPGDRGHRSWALAWAVAAAGALAAAGSLAWLRRRRTRSALSAQKDQAPAVGEVDHPPAL